MAVVKHPEQRVGIFIDTQNLYHSARNLYNARVNFANIVNDALAGRKLIRAISYVITTEAGDERPFFDALKKLGIETKTKNLQIFYGGAKKADWDVGLAVDAIKLAPKLDVIIIVSGDGDYVPLVEYLKAQAQVEAMGFGKSTSGLLREAVDEFIDLCEDPSRYTMESARSRQQKSGQLGNLIAKATNEDGSSESSKTKKPARKSATKTARKTTSRKKAAKSHGTD